MQTPKCVTIGEFQAQVQGWLDGHTKKVGENRWVCAETGAVIQQIVAFMSLHDARFGDSCAGWGEVKRVPIPYCQDHEPKPAEGGCLHV